MKLFTYIIKTADGKFAIADNNLGLAANWSTDSLVAFQFSEERAAFWIRRMNALIPNYAVMVLTSSQQATPISDEIAQWYDERRLTEADVDHLAEIYSEGRVYNRNASLRSTHE